MLFPCFDEDIVEDGDPFTKEKVTVRIGEGFFDFISEDRPIHAF